MLQLLCGQLVPTKHLFLEYLSTTGQYITACVYRTSVPYFNSIQTGYPQESKLLVLLKMDIFFYNQIP